MEIKGKAQAAKTAAADAEKAKKEAAAWMEGADIRRMKRYGALGDHAGHNCTPRSREPVS